MSWQTPGGEPPPDPAAPTPPDPVTPPTDPTEPTERFAAVPTPTPDPAPAASEAPAAPGQGLLSAAPVGWAAPDQSAASTPAPGGPEVAWAPPAAAAATVSMGDGLVIAGVFSRLVAYAIDAGFIGIAYFVVLAVVGGGYSGRVTAGFLAVSVILLAAEAIYFIGFWRSSWHATLGMRLIRVRVLRSVDGAGLPFNAAAIRWVALFGLTTALGFIPAIGSFLAFLWVVALLVTTATNPLRQGLHDRWAGSVVVQPAPGGSGAAVVGCLVLIAIGFALPFILLIMLGSQVQDILSTVGNSI